MNSVERLEYPRVYITCAISAHLFFESVASAVILLVWRLHIMTHFHVWILMHGSEKYPMNGLHTPLFSFYSPCYFSWSKKNSLWRHRWVFFEIGVVAPPSPDCLTRRIKTPSNSWHLKWPEEGGNIFGQHWVTNVPPRKGEDCLSLLWSSIA